MRSQVASDGILLDPSLMILLWSMEEMPQISVRCAFISRKRLQIRMSHVSNKMACVDVDVIYGRYATSTRMRSFYRLYLSLALDDEDLFQGLVTYTTGWTQRVLYGRSSTSSCFHVHYQNLLRRIQKCVSDASTATSNKTILMIFILIATGVSFLRLMWEIAISSRADHLL
jgi:hypothetical protein